MIGITMGDSSGVGPEILLQAFKAGELPRDLVVYGDASALALYNEKLAYGVLLRVISEARGFEPGPLNVIDAKLLSKGAVTPGLISRESGRAAREYVVAATKAALAKEIAAIVTLPMNKEATQLSDPGFTGHTELIGGLCGVEDVTIMLASEHLMVTHVSTHCSLRQAVERVTLERVQTIIRMTCEAVCRLKPGARIAVAGLNPHAGEGGSFGDEEIRVIRPAVEWAQAQGWPVEGPLPPDTVFFHAVRKRRHEVVVCMYHDQGHIPIKLLDFETGVNVALGLPIIRTSVDHGTAFDIAGHGVASTASLLAAVHFALRLTRT
jgi:4-hydroxythreonine-4-phosphate dehydrogenase